MTGPRILYYLMRADFLERVRRNSFWFVVAFSVFLSYLFLPPIDAESLAFALGPWRGIYNSAWVGTTFGILSVMVLSLFGFYLVKNAIDRDRQLRLGQIIATTPIRKTTYMLGKWLSNLAVLSLIPFIYRPWANFSHAGSRCAYCRQNFGSCLRDSLGGGTVARWYSSF